MKNKVAFVMRFSIFVNIFLAVLKIISGLIFSSSALISDGIHSFSDLITDLIAVIGSFLAQKPADKEHPYGHGKIEYLTSLIIGLIVIIIGIGVIYNAFTSELVIPSIIVVLVSVITIITKFLLSRYIILQGKKYNNNILIASGRESRMDVVSSIIVLLSTILVQISTRINLLIYADLVASVIVGIFIMYNGFNILKDNASVVLGEQENNEVYIMNIKKMILDIKDVLEIKSLMIMKFGHISNLTLTIFMDGDTTINKSHEVADFIEDKIKSNYEEIEFINIHIEPLKKVDNK